MRTIKITSTQKRVAQLMCPICEKDGQDCDKEESAIGYYSY